MNQWEIRTCLYHRDWAGKIRFHDDGPWLQACEKCAETGTALQVVIQDGLILGPFPDSNQDVDEGKES